MEFYDLMSLQGQGAFGKVWKARHRLTGHLVAIKIYDPIKMKDQSLKALLMNEIKAMKRVSHKHSMQFLESFQHHNKVTYYQTYCVFSCLVLFCLVLSCLVLPCLSHVLLSSPIFLISMMS
jgi:serine/threonine protein kinase